MRAAVRRVLFLLQNLRVVGVYGLVGDVVVVEVFHDVYLATVWPFHLIIGLHPYSRPHALRAVEACAHLHLAVSHGVLALGVESAGYEASRVGFEVGVESAAQNELAVAHGVERVGVRHILTPVGCAALYLCPRAAVESGAVEVVLPNEAVLVWRGCESRCAEEQSSESCLELHVLMGFMLQKYANNLCAQRECLYKSLRVCEIIGFGRAQSPTF